MTRMELEGLKISPFRFAPVEMTILISNKNTNVVVKIDSAIQNGFWLNGIKRIGIPCTARVSKFYIYTHFAG